MDVYSMTPEMHAQDAAAKKEARAAYYTRALSALESAFSDWDGRELVTREQSAARDQLLVLCETIADLFGETS